MRYRLLGILVCVFGLLGADHKGQVKYGEVGVPGVTVTASKGEQKVAVITDAQGNYTFPELAEGTWSISVDMSGFSATQKDITVAAGAPPVEWSLTMLPLAEMNARVQAPLPPPPAAAGTPGTPAPKKPASEAFANLSPEELGQRAADGFLINGTANNAASSPFSQAQAFGNNRRGGRPLYNGNLGFILDHSIFDARPYSLTGQNTPRPDFSRLQGVLAFGGPLRIPHLFRRNEPNLTLNYQWTRNGSVTNQTGLAPTADMRNGILPGLIIPATQISDQARKLLALYPLPNLDNNSRYNYQVPIIGAMHDDNLQTRFNQRLPKRNQLSGTFTFQSTRTDSPNLFGFQTNTYVKNMGTGVNWVHLFHPRFYTVLGFNYNRFLSKTTPFFAGNRNVSAEAGITGNNQDSDYWGPPTLIFASGIASLSDSIKSTTRNQASQVTFLTGWGRGNHNWQFGGNYQRQQNNLLTQEDPRGTFTFTGQGTGSDFAGFLKGIPDASSIAFGNADKYFRATNAAVFATDDWRIKSGLTLNLGVRWEYASPLKEKYGRLVNLDIADGFRAATPVVAGNQTLIRPDRNNIAPRLAFAWRPMPASSMLIRGSYGVYYDTSVYLGIITQMAQQSPLSKSLRGDITKNPLTLRDGFNTASAVALNTFAVDPDFRIGYSQNWQVSMQRDLPASLVMIATYAGVRGSRAQQQVLPNTYPTGVTNPCPACPAGFAFLASNGNSIRHAGTMEVRRRLKSGFTATASYTFAKSIDNAALGGRNQGGVLIAQNWLDLDAERALSNFDQRHLSTVQIQYTSGMGKSGGTLLSGWTGRLLKEWTATTAINSGSGLPLTPIVLRTVSGTGVAGPIRGDYTGVSLYDAPPGQFLNPAAFVAPPAGRWGNAGRNSITGPSTFTLNASMGRTFRLNERLNFDFRIDATNALNHPVYQSWNTVVGNPQFGFANNVNPMRSLQMTGRLRF